jgi:uncharacterized BrkB/YihY/UPF0761 family membrane protein
MAWLGLGLLLVACVFAGMAMAPLFNRFLPQGHKRRSAMGCLWILAAIAAAWLGFACLFSVKTFDPNAPEWQADSTNLVDIGE